MSVKIWDTASWECERTLQVGERVESLVVSGDTVLAGLGDGSIKLHNWKTGDDVGTLQHGNDWLDSLVVTISGKLCSGSHEGSIKIWT